MQDDPAPTVGDHDWCALRVVGEDAVTFLQSQVSQDLEGDGVWPRWTAVLDPDGTVVSAGVLDPAEAGFELFVPDETHDAVLARLNRFRLRARLTITSRREVSGPYPSHLAAMRDGWPGSEEFAARLVAQSYGSRFVARTVSFSKGCFTGQDLVGRGAARASSVPWRLVRARGDSIEVIDEFLRSTGPAGPSGVTSSAPDDGGGFLALGFAHRTLLTVAPPSSVSVEALA
ncbi:MAG: YgfZ family protein [Acidimicrobiales bacterium]